MNDDNNEEIKFKLMLLTRSLGRAFGTEELSSIIYGLIRMQKPKNIVELGTGLGVTSFWMAQALKENNTDGHLWTIDDGEGIKGLLNFEDIMKSLVESNGGINTIESLEGYITAMSEDLYLDDFMTFINKDINLADKKHFDTYPFSDHNIDLLFSDFNHEPNDVISVLGHFLPRMALSSSIFIDSVSTYWPSYLLLENIIDAFNKGVLPEIFRPWGKNMQVLVKNSKFTLMHLTKPDRDVHNGTAWIKIEPIDVRPYPLTVMRCK